MLEAWQLTDGMSECWIWTGPLANENYGLFNYTTPLGVHLRPRAHRFAYELAVGPIGDGLQLDHLCHTNDLSCLGGSECPHRRCANPAHLDPVTALVNSRRSRNMGSEKSHCPRGHPYVAENIYQYGPAGKICRACALQQTSARRVARTLARGGTPNLRKTTAASRAEMVEAYINGESRASIAQRFGISKCRVYQITRPSA